MIILNIRQKVIQLFVETKNLLSIRGMASGLSLGGKKMVRYIMKESTKTGCASVRTVN